MDPLTSRCFCGSGLPLMKCHGRGILLQHVVTQTVGIPFPEIAYPISRPTYSSPGQIIHETNRLAKQEYCSCPASDRARCQKRIIQAHSVAKSDALKKIARDGHVYTLMPEGLATLVKNEGRLGPRLVGINKASTFTGFCGFHDREIFSPIENQPLQAIPEHAFLLAYRAVARADFAKRVHKKTNQYMLSLAKKQPIDLRLSWEYDFGKMGQEIDAGMRDLKQTKDMLDGVLLSKNFDTVRFYAIEFDRVPEVMTSLLVNPEFDFAGHACQAEAWGDLNSKLAFITFTMVHMNGGGVAFFAWLDDGSTVNTDFIRSLHALSDQDVPHAILRFIFEFSENTYMAPAWWDALDPKIRDALILRMESGATVNEDNRGKRKPDCLLDDGIRIINWNVVARHHNVAL